MKKLLVGLLALGSISSFAVDLNSCDVSELNIHTDNDISLKDTEDIKKKLSEKGYLFDNLGADAGLVINIGLQREHGFHSAQKYAGVNQGKTKLGTFFNIVGTNLHNLGADIKDVYNMTTVKAFRGADV